MIIGAHTIIYSTKPEADRAFLRDVLEFPHVDVGEGWLIFGLPPSEVAVHPSDENDLHEFYLMCEDINALVDELATHGVACAPPTQQGWGVLTHVTLPGGGKLGIYQPRHARPEAMGTAAKRAARAKAASASKAAKGRPAKATAKAKARTGAKAVGASANRRAAKSAIAARAKDGRGAGRKKTRRA